MLSRVNADADVVVAGGGPAGSAAALVLARAGARVLVVDAQTFPRDKVCGDLVGTEAVRTLDRLGIAAAVLAGALRLTGAVLHGPAGRRTGTHAGRERGPRPGDACVIAREVFDARLLGAAREAGASFTQARVLGVIRDANGTVAGVRTTTGDVRARITIAADGWGSNVARDLGLAAARTAGGMAVVARSYVRGVRGLGACMHFYINPASDGYAWLFPVTDDVANVGLGFVRGEPGEGDVRAALARFLGPHSAASSFLMNAQAAGVATWPIPLGPQRMRVAVPGAFLCGDAAALASPLSGSGIHHALASGAAAGRFASSSLDGRTDAWPQYARWVRRHVTRRLAVERRMHRAAGTAARVDPWLTLARAIPGAEDALARALLALG